VNAVTLLGDILRKQLPCEKNNNSQNHYMSLFQNSVINKYLKGVDQDKEIILKSRKVK